MNDHLFGVHFILHFRFCYRLKIAYFWDLGTCGPVQILFFHTLRCELDHILWFLPFQVDHGRKSIGILTQKAQSFFSWTGLIALKKRIDATCPEQLTVMSLPMRPFLDLGVRHPVKYVYRSKSFSQSIVFGLAFHSLIYLPGKIRWHLLARRFFPSLKVARGITFPRNAYRSEMLTTWIRRPVGLSFPHRTRGIGDWESLGTKGRWNYLKQLALPRPPQLLFCCLKSHYIPPSPLHFCFF